MCKGNDLQSKYIELHDLLIHNEVSPDNEQVQTLRQKVIELLEEPYKSRFSSLDLFETSGSIAWKNVMIATTIFKDQLYKYTNVPQTKEDIEIHKLLKARECDEEFESSLAILIVGDNDKYPYRSSYYITQFFQNLGFNETHDGSTRRIWVTNVLRRLPITDIYKIVKQGLFRKRYFLDAKKDIDVAIEDFKNMLEYCYSANEVYDISSAFELNINTELLFSEHVNSSDITLNELVEDSRDKYLKGDKQGAVEKIWDALERSKTILNKDKGKGIKALCETCAIDLDDTFYNDEYKLLTDIGNNYQIRHFETNKKEIKDEDTLKYLYFRAFTLVNYAIKKLNTKTEDNIEGVNE